MNRRGFLGRVVGGVAAAATLPVLANAEATPNEASKRHQPGSMAFDSDGNVYRYVCATNNVTAGDLVVDTTTHIHGVAVSQIRAGDYAWVMVGGQAMAKVKTYQRGFQPVQFGET